MQALDEDGRDVFEVRGVAPHVVAVQDGDDLVVRFAAVKYAGSWDLNPAIQNSVLASLKENTSIDVDFTPHAVSLADKSAGHFPLLFMTGHYDFQFSDAEAVGLARYLNRGGLLVVSSGAGRVG